MSRRYNVDDQTKLLIYKLNEQYRRTERRLKQDFNLNLNKEVKRPTQLTNSRDMDAYIKRLSKAIEKGRGYRTNTVRELKYTPKTVINKHGIEIDKDKYRKLNYYKNRINKQRADQLKRVNFNRPYLTGGRDTGLTISDIKKQRATLPDEFQIEQSRINNVVSKQGLNRMMKHKAKASKKSYYTTRYEQYQKNFLTAINNQFGGGKSTKQTLNLRKKVKSVDAFLFYASSISNNRLEIDYIYKLDSETINDRMNVIMSELDSLDLDRLRDNLG